METILIVLEVLYVITFILFGFLIRHYRNIIEKKVQFGNEFFNRYLDLCVQKTIIENQNLKYSKISRNLYNNNQDLRLDNSALLEKVAKLETKKKKNEKMGV
jgi:hypothetical protein